MMRSSTEFFLPIKVRRILNLILVASILFLLGISLTNAVNTFLENQNEILQMRSSVAALLTSESKSSRDLAPSLPDIDLGSTLAESPEAAINHMQQIVRNLNETLKTSDIQIDSVRILPSLQEGTLTASRASVSMTTSHRSLFDAINIVESSTPAIIIDSIRINNRMSGSLSNRNSAMSDESANNKTQIKVNFSLRSYSENSAKPDKAKNTNNRMAPQRVFNP